MTIRHFSSSNRTTAGFRFEFCHRMFTCAELCLVRMSMTSGYCPSCADVARASYEDEIRSVREDTATEDYTTYSIATRVRWYRTFRRQMRRLSANVTQRPQPGREAVSVLMAARPSNPPRHLS